MIVFDCQQGSEAWDQLRLGIPTASCFDEILTPVELKFSKASAKYRTKLLTEWLLGMPLETYQSPAMEHGSLEEPKARRFYEMQYDVDVQRIGFVLRDDRKVGGSPDGFVGEDGGLEIKCPKPETHVAYMREPKKLAAAYKHQIQGNLYLTNRAWWDIISYCADLPPVLFRVERDEKYIAALIPALEQFIEELDADKKQFGAHKLPSYATQVAEAIA